MKSLFATVKNCAVTIACETAKLEDKMLESLKADVSNEDKPMKERLIKYSLIYGYLPVIPQASTFRAFLASRGIESKKELLVFLAENDHMAAVLFKAPYRL
jgi:hypothetical protein